MREVSRRGEGEKSAEVEIDMIGKAVIRALTPLVVKASKFSTTA